MQLADIDLHNPDNFVEGVPHEMFRVLRREAPVFWHEEPDGPGFWVVTKYADVKWISTHPRQFISSQGTNIHTLPPEHVERQQALMLNMDPPKHVRYRRIVQKSFTPRRVADLEPHIRELSNEIIDRVADKGECDFVSDLAADLPLLVICELMGVPKEDRALLFELTNKLIGFDDPEFQTEQTEGLMAAAQMFAYAGQLAERMRESPEDNLTSALLQSEVDGERLSELDFNSFFMLLIVAGNETTRTVTSNGMRLLIEHPDQRRRLLEDPSLIPRAVEEFVRFAPAVHHFRRTASEDTELRGERIAAGDKVTIWYPSANRDEEVFSDPDRFDVGRTPNDHLAFGIGEHFCLGASLARLELTVIFEEFLRRLPDLELAGPVRRLRSNFVNGVKEMPVRFTPEHEARG